MWKSKNAAGIMHAAFYFSVCTDYLIDVQKTVQYNISTENGTDHETRIITGN